MGKGIRPDAVLRVCGGHGIKGRASMELQSFSVLQPKVWGLLLFPSSS